MNIVLDLSQVEIINIHLMETKKNIIIDGKFTKIMYSDQFISFNGLFIFFPLQHNKIDKLNNKNIFYFNIQQNSVLLKQTIDMEKLMIEKYMNEYNISKKIVLSLNNQLNTGKFKLYNEMNKINKHMNSNIVLKISGIWETEDEIGIAYKFIEMFDN